MIALSYNPSVLHHFRPYFSLHFLCTLRSFSPCFLIISLPCYLIVSPRTLYLPLISPALSSSFAVYRHLISPSVFPYHLVFSSLSIIPVMSPRVFFYVYRFLKLISVFHPSPLSSPFLPVFSFHVLVLSQTFFFLLSVFTFSCFSIIPT